MWLGHTSQLASNIRKEANYSSIFRNTKTVSSQFSQQRKHSTHISSIWYSKFVNNLRSIMLYAYYFFFCFETVAMPELCIKLIDGCWLCVFGFVENCVLCLPLNLFFSSYIKCEYICLCVKSHYKFLSCSRRTCLCEFAHYRIYRMAQLYPMNVTCRELVLSVT